MHFGLHRQVPGKGRQGEAWVLWAPSMVDVLLLRLPLRMDRVWMSVNPAPYLQKHLQRLRVFELPVFLSGGNNPLRWAQVKGNNFTSQDAVIIQVLVVIIQVLVLNAIGYECLCLVL